ncbi:MAG: hypothetical protein F6K40_20265 [Okeania sp. SIO3I5]|uniref:hypothetical protein n=1 Tax=Okeania sp. SIO3I5 TaxID=2607805 RepID=UPI0013BC9FCA|nr:hypothetical protein [Okeania sp. SIO3I5]NEQ38475.1 hypothetical protein [Okeania sp. SIO3I5]
MFTTEFSIDQTAERSNVGANGIRPYRLLHRIVRLDRGKSNGGQTLDVKIAERYLFSTHNFFLNYCPIVSV